MDSVLTKQLQIVKITLILLAWKLVLKFLSNYRGNFPDRLGKPYETGKPCSSCKRHCTKNRKSKSKGRKTKVNEICWVLNIEIDSKIRLCLINQQMKHNSIICTFKLALLFSMYNTQLIWFFFKKRKRKQSRHPLIPSLLTKRTKKPRSHFAKNHFCTNACPVADMWSNCHELVKKWPDWMCSNRNNSEGLLRFQSCRATCNCPNRIKN